MSKRPLIGITPSFSEESHDYILNNKYIEAIREAGGIPLVIPYLDLENIEEEIFSFFDGFLLSGGGDVHPSFYGEELENVEKVVLERDKFEIELVKRCFENKRPLLGICRGLQVMNVAMGGTLIQDIKSDITHRQPPPYDKPVHSITVYKNSQLYQILGIEELTVNSSHHQAIKNLGKELKVSAQADDGVIEAIESEKHPFFIGVQFHPERLFNKNEAFLKLFKSFVNSCKRSI
ncbi:MAG: gamma-glutamyl-gamma-aminobutyrate hydrolase family protein [Candidatus Hydrothermales bacterium]